jgi:hypothetical protein
MVNRYGSPYILKEFNPHFTLCSAMPENDAERADIIRELGSCIEPGIREPCEIGEIVLAGRSDEDQRWSVLERFRLRG